MRAINEDEKKTFDLITQSDSPHLALMSTKLHGIETACICWIEEDKADYTVQPLAVIVNDAIFSKLKDPMEDSSEAGK